MTSKELLDRANRMDDAILRACEEYERIPRWRLLKRFNETWRINLMYSIANGHREAALYADLRERQGTPKYDSTLRHPRDELG